MSCISQQMLSVESFVSCGHFAYLLSQFEYVQSNEDFSGRRFLLWLCLTHFGIHGYCLLACEFPRDILCRTDKSKEITGVRLSGNHYLIFVKCSFCREI